MHEYRIELQSDEKWIPIGSWDYPNPETTQRGSAHHGLGVYRLIHFQTPTGDTWEVAILPR